MSDSTASLDGASILILEDDYYQATDLQRAIEAEGAVVIGPFSDKSDAVRSLEERRPDCAFVDVNLGLGQSFDVPRALMRLGVPFSFVTGYDEGAIPEEFDAVQRLEKPVDARKVATIALQLLAGPGPRPT